MRRKLAAGNWKMNGSRAALDEARAIAAASRTDGPGVLLCPPATLLAPMAEIADGTAMKVGGQYCHPAGSGAHTGHVSAPMLCDAGASYVIVGHSERRQDDGAPDADVQRQTTAAWEAGLTAIECVGEAETERDAGDTLGIVGGQLGGSIPDAATAGNLVVAYEPVWAIGTGKVPSLAQIGEVHDFIRRQLEQRFGQETGQSVPLLYGGSVKPGNAAEIFAVSNVDGALVGGASLKAADFTRIIAALG